MPVTVSKRRGAQILDVLRDVSQAGDTLTGITDATKVRHMSLKV